eukprot:1829738-Rhodomonas_salina.2
MDSERGDCVFVFESPANLHRPEAPGPRALPQLELAAGARARCQCQWPGGGSRGESAGGSLAHGYHRRCDCLRVRLVAGTVAQCRASRSTGVSTGHCGADGSSIHYVSTGHWVAEGVPVPDSTQAYAKPAPRTVRYQTQRQ